MERTLNSEAEKFLVEYGAELLHLHQKFPFITEDKCPSYSDRLWAFENHRNAGVKRIWGLVAEFGKMVNVSTA